MWKEQKYRTVPFERSVRSNISAGRKFVRYCRVNVYSLKAAQEYSQRKKLMVDGCYVSVKEQNLKLVSRTESAHYLERFHMMWRPPYWCSKPIPWELNSFLMQTLIFVSINSCIDAGHVSENPLYRQPRLVIAMEPQTAKFKPTSEDDRNFISSSQYDKRWHRTLQKSSSAMIKTCGTVTHHDIVLLKRIGI